LVLGKKKEGDTGQQGKMNPIKENNGNPGDPQKRVMMGGKVGQRFCKGSSVGGDQCRSKKKKDVMSAFGGERELTQPGALCKKKIVWGGGILRAHKLIRMRNRLVTDAKGNAKLEKQ